MLRSLFVKINYVTSISACKHRRSTGFTFDRFIKTISSAEKGDTKSKITGIKKRIEPLCNCDDSINLRPCSKSSKCQYRVNQVPVFIRTYGCQMNANDTAIIATILQEYGYKIVDKDDEAEIYLLMTCAIRESAESKIWSKLNHLRSHKQNKNHPLKQIGLLGCMAERLKEKVLESSSGSVDIIAGPDSYRDLPRLFSANKLTNEKAVNCLLSFDETYSDIRPITKIGDVTAYVSITRGCDNLCSYCIVPFTRGRERSRPIDTIISEVKNLLDNGIKEVTLLGQNVNSYRDLMTPPETISRFDLLDRIKERESPALGFKTVYKPRTRGLTFDVLLEEIAKISPELRVRFTSPHPKDFTDEVIEVMSKYQNISRCIHLPAQSGSDKVLERMRRGHTKKAYLELVQRLRAAIEDLTFTSDFIAGFCGETEDDHLETIDLIKNVGYTYIYAYPYSMRDKTHAYHKHIDDVDHETKTRRVQEILNLFRTDTDRLNKRYIGTKQLVLIESESRRSTQDWKGKVDYNIKTILAKGSIHSEIVDCMVPMKPGDYVVCEITEANSQTLKAIPLYITTQESFNNKRLQETVDRRSMVS